MSNEINIILVIWFPYEMESFFKNCFSIKNFWNDFVPMKIITSNKSSRFLLTFLEELTKAFLDLIIRSCVPFPHFSPYLTFSLVKNPWLLLHPSMVATHSWSLLKSGPNFDPSVSTVYMCVKSNFPFLDPFYSRGISRRIKGSRN